ncbi:hypothetical protein EsH8_II_001043 [Colletotrichum jinshuiense]
MSLSSPPSSHLPTPRALITSLINSLTSASLPPSAAPPSNYGAGGDDNRNPLKSLPQAHRPLLVTLHVLFPSIVLPALDLLDRNLITRVVPEASSTVAGGAQEQHPADPAPDQSNQANNSSDHDAAAGEQGSSPPIPRHHLPPAAAAFHLVRSVASTLSRRNHAGGTSASAATTYLVQLDAWNCTCASFAFEAFPADAAGYAEDAEFEIRNADAAEDSDQEGPAKEWQFGGLSQNGLDHGSVPCCKHLLGCLLSEQWGNALGKYVMERRVSREEMAGLIAGV